MGKRPAAAARFGHRAPHVVALATKAIIAKYYGARAAYSYFRGCSSGGREGLSEAQFFPDDFNGIIAGDPAFPGRLGGIANVWEVQQLFTANGGHTISDAKLALIHTAVVKQCDAEDGVADGIISDPRDCRFEARSLACPAGQDRPNCLDATELHAAEEVYAGAHDSRGRRLYPGGAAFGSELAWYRFILPLSEGYLRYLAFQQNPPPDYSYRQYNFDRDLVKVEASAREYDPVAPHGAPDLRAFQQHGGKLIEYEGWADSGVSPFEVLDYYAQVTHREGGRAVVGEWYRLYMVPGMYHCMGGDVPDHLDTLTAIIDWVEKKSAPDRLVAIQLSADGKVVRTRPIFPYPTVAHYQGSGDVNEARNWSPAEPKMIHDDRVQWIWAPAQ